MEINDNELIRLREHFNRSHILLCFNGPTSRGLIEEIGQVLEERRHLYEQAAHHIVDASRSMPASAVRRSRR